MFAQLVLLLVLFFDIKLRISAVALLVNHRAKDSGKDTNPRQPTDTGVISALYAYYI